MEAWAESRIICGRLYDDFVLQIVDRQNKNQSEARDVSKFLRDRFISNLSLNPERLMAISEILVALAETANQNVSVDDPQRVTTNYVIRFDNKGFVVDDFQTVLIYHNGAKRTERITFLLQSEASRLSNAQTGKLVELRLDALSTNNCSLSVQDDDAAWTDAAYCRIDEELRKYGNRHYLVRNAWTTFFVQILGVLAGVFLSLWAALRISPKLSIDYAFVVSFVFALLVFSNIWTYLNQRILDFFDFIFPNISFKESRGLHWLGRALISAVFIAAAFFALDALFGVIGRILGEILS